MTTSQVVAPKKTNYGHLFTGGVAGAVSRTATSPFERLRILQQTVIKEYVGLGTFGSFKQMYKLEGLAGYFKGNGATVSKIAPFSAFEFYFYEVYKNTLFPGKQKNEFTYMQKLICGGLTGSTASFLTYPLDLIKTFLTINVEHQSMGIV